MVVFLVFPVFFCSNTLGQPHFLMCFFCTTLLPLSLYRSKCLETCRSEIDLNPRTPSYLLHKSVSERIRLVLIATKEEIIPSLPFFLDTNMVPSSHCSPLLPSFCSQSACLCPAVSEQERYDMMVHTTPVVVDQRVAASSFDSALFESPVSWRVVKSLFLPGVTGYSK